MDTFKFSIAVAKMSKEEIIDILPKLCEAMKERALSIFASNKKFKHKTIPCWMFDTQFGILEYRASLPKRGVPSVATCKLNVKNGCGETISYSVQY